MNSARLPAAGTKGLILIWPLCVCSRLSSKEQRPALLVSAHDTQLPLLRRPLIFYSCRPGALNYLVAAAAAAAGRERRKLPAAALLGS
jgi:hypothetical protein